MKTVAWGGGGGRYAFCVGFGWDRAVSANSSATGKSPLWMGEKLASIQGAEYLNLQQTQALNKG